MPSQATARPGVGLGPPLRCRRGTAASPSAGSQKLRVCVPCMLLVHTQGDTNRIDFSIFQFIYCQ